MPESANRTPAIRELLEACEAYFADRADADIDASGPTGNEEMGLLVQVREALGK